MSAPMIEPVRDWRAVGCPVGQWASPEDVDWGDAFELHAPTTIAAATAAVGRAGPGPGDWWLGTRVLGPGVLRFDGLTFPGSVFLDGDQVQTVDSMFLPVEVPLPVGEHEVVLRFESLAAWLRKRRPRGRWRSSLVAAQGLRWARTTLIGHAAVFGDVPIPIGPWRPVSIDRSPVRELSTDARVEGTDGIVVLAGRLQGAEAALATIAGRSVPLQPDADGRFIAEIRIPDADLWWPNGYGGQHLYELTLTVDGEVCCQRTVGFRTIEADESAGGFALSVNGVPTFMRGATWVPPDLYRLWAEPDRLRAELKTLADAGATMVRVTGGLVSEQIEFWQYCAEFGLLVWQDAMQATLDPPDEMADLIVEELRELLRSASGNPALAVLSGGSETLQQPEMVGLDRDARTIPLITGPLHELAGRASLPYVPGTPSAPTGDPGLAIRPDTGTAHWFGVGGYLRPLTDVRTAGIRFAAETLAFSTPPDPGVVERDFGSPAVAGHDPVWKQGIPRDRGSSWDFEDVRDHYVRELFSLDPLMVRRTDPERYLQLGRAAAVTVMTECFRFWRRSDSGCAGALVLSARDTGPGAGWGLLDAHGGSKATLRALRRCWAPVAVMVADAGMSGIRIDVFNDSDVMLSGTMELVAVSATGTEVVRCEQPIDLAPRESLTRYDAELTGSFADFNHVYRFGTAIAGAVQVTVSASGRAARDVLVVDPLPQQAHSGLEAALIEDGDGWCVEVRSAVALRHVTIESAGWTPQDDWFSLAPGLPYRVQLNPMDGTDPAKPPRGQVSSIDSLPVARFGG